MKQLFISIFILFHLTCFAATSHQYYSQCGQDKLVNENYFHDLKSGVFVDIGAHNGLTYSNTYFFEKELGWKGICVEPIPAVFNELKQNRNCICVQGCVADRSGEGQLLMITSPCVNTQMLSGLIDKYDRKHVKRIKREVERCGGSYQEINVKCYLLNELLEQNSISHVNFLSIDTEGGEFDILSSIDFSRYQIDVITVEDNYGDSRFIPFLSEKGFNFVQKQEQDLIFVNKNFKYFTRK